MRLKKTCTLARVWRQQRCSCCHNCSEHNNRNCPVSCKLTPAQVAGSTWGSVCVRGACPRRQQWAWLRCQQASSNFRLTVSLLKRPGPFASAANATSERIVSQREHRKRYGTFVLRNARLHTKIVGSECKQVINVTGRRSESNYTARWPAKVMKCKLSNVDK